MLTAIYVSTCSSERRSNGPISTVPAFKKTAPMSISASSLQTSSLQSVIVLNPEKSTWTAFVWIGCFKRSSANLVSIFSKFRAMIQILNPQPANWLQRASPIPSEPPVTTANVFPSALERYLSTRLVYLHLKQCLLINRAVLQRKTNNFHAPITP